jgi:hypothetical protein
MCQRLLAGAMDGATNAERVKRGDLPKVVEQVEVTAVLIATPAPAGIHI